VPLFSTTPASSREVVGQSTTLGTVVFDEEQHITRLVRERTDVDWVVDEEDPRWDSGVENHAQALSDFKQLNDRIFRVMKEAAQKFQAFLSGAVRELEPYGLEVLTYRPRLLSPNPEEWVSPEFIIATEVKDARASLFAQPTEGLFRFRVDVRRPVVIKEELHDVSFMAYSDRDNHLTPGNMLIQALYPLTHFESEDFEEWRRNRLETING